MTDEQFAIGVDAIIMTGVKGHAAHRALDMLWTRYTQELPADHPLRLATAKWMRAIEGDHTPGNPYPLGAKRWWQKPFRCMIGIHRWKVDRDLSGWGLDGRTCRRCGKHESAGNPCH